MLVIPINYVVAQGGETISPAPGALQQALEQARLATLSEHVKQLEEQHNQDLQIMFLLIAIIAGLGSGIIALCVIFIKNRNLKTKPTPETEHKED